MIVGRIRSCAGRASFMGSCFAAGPDSQGQHTRGPGSVSLVRSYRAGRGSTPRWVERRRQPLQALTMITATAPGTDVTLTAGCCPLSIQQGCGHRRPTVPLIESCAAEIMSDRYNRRAGQVAISDRARTSADSDRPGHVGKLLVEHTSGRQRRRQRQRRPRPMPMTSRPRTRSTSATTTTRLTVRMRRAARAADPSRRVSLAVHPATRCATRGRAQARAPAHISTSTTPQSSQLLTE